MIMNALFFYARDRRHINSAMTARPKTPNRRCYWLGWAKGNRIRWPEIIKQAGVNPEPNSGRCATIASLIFTRYNGR